MVLCAAKHQSHNFGVAVHDDDDEALGANENVLIGVQLQMISRVQSQTTGNFMRLSVCWYHSNIDASLPHKLWCLFTPQSRIIFFSDVREALWLKEEKSCIGKGPKKHLLSYRLRYLYLQAFNQTNRIKTDSTYATDFGWFTWTSPRGSAYTHWSQALRHRFHTLLPCRTLAAAGHPWHEKQSFLG